ncbi:MAG: hypothetical protein JWP71_1260 [Mucilaginibacter sp.]|nr:hypothetical protein [Mucilaginibacter sp.]
MTNDQMTKKYILKPGKHQFTPGSAAIHDNNNLSDKEAKWYLDRYPHIKSLFTQLPIRSKRRSKRNEVTI